MEMKYVVPDMAQSFGTLEFAGESEPVFERDKNNRRVLAKRSYNLYSDVQKGENVVVEIPVQAGEKKFKYEQKVKLVNPKLYGRGYAIGDTVKVHIDADGDMVIVQNPTLAPAIEKSDYEPKTSEADASVDADTVNDATAFLETFFKLYPTATEKELAYYVLGNVIEPIGRDYIYSELVNPIFIKDGDNVKVKVAVKFIDNQTKATQVSQYELVLHKDSNWKIVG